MNMNSSMSAISQLVLAFNLMLIDLLHLPSDSTDLLWESEVRHFHNEQHDKVKLIKLMRTIATPVSPLFDDITFLDFPTQSCHYTVNQSILTYVAKAREGQQPTTYLGLLEAKVWVDTMFHSLDIEQAQKEDKQNW